jgi:chorismate mutase/prephenate dehydratase
MTDSDRRELDALRSAIDEVDDVILKALADRANLSRKVRELKSRAGTPHFSPRREREILDRVEQKGAGDFPKKALLSVFREILSGSVALEAPLRVAYEGPPGSLAHEAARKRFGASAEYLPCEGARATLDLVQRDHADVSVVMLESSVEGLLQPALDALADSELKIIGELEADARVHVLIRTGNLADIEKVYAAPHERHAAARFLDANLPRATVLDTRTPAMAAQLAAEDHGAAALGGAVVGEMFGLQVARGNVADAPGEHVRCAVLGTRPAMRSGHDSTSFLVTLDDAPGALLRILKPLAERDLNLRRIQSRPRALGDAEGAKLFRFFMEVAGHVTDRALISAFDDMKRGVRQLKILGSYPSKN